MKPSNFRGCVTLNQGECPSSFRVTSQSLNHFPNFGCPSCPSCPLGQGAELTALKGKPSMQSRGSSRTTESLSQILVPHKHPNLLCVWDCIYIYGYIHTWCRMRVDYPGIYIYINEYLDFSLDFCWTCLAKIYQNLAGYGTEQPNLETGICQTWRIILLQSIHQIHWLEHIQWTSKTRWISFNNTTECNKKLYIICWDYVNTTSISCTSVCVCLCVCVYTYI